MVKIFVSALLFVAVLSAADEPSLPATDITAAAIQAFVKALPPDAVSDKPIRVVDVGGYRVGIYGVFRPKSSKQEAILHETKVTEVYQMMEGAGTLVTGGTIVDGKRVDAAGIGHFSVRGPSIVGGVSRRVVKGDVVIIPGWTPHWWSNLEGDITYMIVRPDPQATIPLK